MTATIRSAVHDGIELAAAAHRSTLLGRLERDDVRAVLDASHAVRHGRGELVRRATDDAVVILLTGAAKAHRPTDRGEPAVVAVLGPGDTTGLVVAAGHPEGGAEVTALEPLDALWIGGHDLRRLIAERHGVASACFLAVAEQLAEVRGRDVAFAGSSTSERVHRLLELVARFGDRGRDAIRLRVNLTQEDLASWAGVSRESLGRVLHTLRTARVIATGRREVTVLDLAGLEARHRSPQRPDVVSALLASLV